MSIGNTYSRTRFNQIRPTSGGPYEALVVNHLDPSYMGTLEVELLRHDTSGNNPERTGQIFTVRYLSPFYGVTPEASTQANEGYEFTQKSYGIWAVPPDIGTKVLVIFAEDNSAYGYWIGCIQDSYMNFQLPGYSPSTTFTRPDTPASLQGKKLPTGEYNKKVETGEGKDPTKFRKPYNKDFTQVLENQGLLADEIRGTTTSSARREVPSMVFGMNTPGPLDKRPGAPKHNYGNQKSKAEQFFNRLGGSSLVFDDGDDKYIRKTHAEDGPPVYANVEAGDVNGDPTIPHNEHIRLRTRTGHQILLHNSEDLIYIGNSRGTAWIELTSDGKIDIHADDSISIMTGADLNITAERDINLEAGRNINMKATARYSGGANFDINDNESGRIQAESAWNTNIDVGNDYKLTVHNMSDTVVDKEMKVLVKEDYHFHTNKSRFQRSDGFTHESSGFSWYRKSDSNIHDVAVGIHFLKNASLNMRSIGGDGGDGDIRYYASGNVEGTIDGYRREKITGEVHLISDSNIRSQSADDTTIISATTIHQEAGTTHHVIAGQSSYHTTGSNVNIQGAGVIAGDAGQIHWNSGLSNAASAGGNPSVSVAALPATDAENPADAVEVIHLPTIQLPYITPGSEDPTYYPSILARSPQHEPWPHHENMNPLAFKTKETDREKVGPLAGNFFTPLTPDTFAKGSGSASATPSGVGGGGTAGAPSSGGGTGVVPGQASSAVPTTNLAPNIGAPLSTDQLVGTIDGFTSEQTAAYLGAIGQRESNNNYTAVNSIGFAGKYQFGASALKDLGYISSSASNRNSSMADPANWTGRNGINSLDDWLNSPQVQERAMIDYTNLNRRYLTSNGGIRTSDDITTISGMLAGSHLLGAGGMNNWRRGAGGADAYGTTGDEYYAIGSGAVQGV